MSGAGSKIKLDQTKLIDIGLLVNDSIFEFKGLNTERVLTVWLTDTGMQSLSMLSFLSIHGGLDPGSLKYTKIKDA